MQLSKHLSLAEVIRSESAKRLGLSNMPTDQHLENFKKLAENVFEPVRNHFNIPIHISSAYRSQALNAAIGGSLTSQHCKGEAIDVDMDGTAITNKQVFDYIKNNLSFDQLIWEFGSDSNPDWVHVSYNTSGKQRKEVLKASKSGNKTKYSLYK